MTINDIPDFVNDSVLSSETIYVHSSVANRQHQMFPELSAAEIARLHRFGEVRSWADGELLFSAGQVGFVLFGRKIPSNIFGGFRWRQKHPTTNHRA